jgi:glycosyltransferase involved in cell wall biosynthesis
LLSVVIPTYNRRAKLPAAIDSALAWVDLLGRGEIVIVDDASDDGSADMVRERYSDRLETGAIRLQRLGRNQGVTAAKNAGAALAGGEWVVFLDSDDRLRVEAALTAVEELGRAGAAPFVFFRCLDQGTGRLIGRSEEEARRVDLKALLASWPWGECLPAVRAEVCCRFPYPEALRGYEGLAYLRMVRDLDQGRLSTIAARDYESTGLDRLSAAASLRGRSCLHVRAYCAILGEFRGAMPIRVQLRYLASIAASSLRCVAVKLGF